jgi:3-dehydroquinate synthetase/shikimate kinase
MSDGLVLVGLSGSGKSTIGRRVAELLRRRFVDTDALIQQRVGKPASAYLRDHGEPAFREVERQAVVDATREAGAVIAAGGGAVADPLNRWDLWHHGTVAWLRAPEPVLLRRLSADTEPRPMLEPNPQARVAALATERAPFYRAADLQVDASGPVEAVAQAILVQSPSRAPATRVLFDAEVPRHHPLGPPRARVVMGIDLDADAVRRATVAVEHSAPSIIVDRAVARLLPHLVAALPARRCLAIAGGERAKRLRRLEQLLEWLASGAHERGAPVFAVGGGTIGDLVGTAVALYARGVPLVQVPTTWLAQADSAFGGKVGVDLGAVKNAAGAFWPPAAVIGDVAALRTLPPARRRDGMTESLKAALIGDPTLWHLIEEHGRAALRGDERTRYAIVERTARVKLAVCERDPFEVDERRTLNLGHTIGHALEAESRYRLPHGPAVAIGLRAAMAIAAGRGADPDLPARLDAVLLKLGFSLRRAFDSSAVRAALLHDKKRTRGRQRWILPMAIGRVVEVDDVTEPELNVVLSAIFAADGPASAGASAP